jgi:HAD superfamily hydrolase (TIGR01509 family)
MKRKYILWDHDGVLVDTEYWFFRATQLTMRELSVDLDQQTYLAYQSEGKTTWDMAKETGFSQETIDKYKTRRYALYHKYLKEENIEIPGILDVLKTLAKQHHMAIVTTTRRIDFNLIHQNRQIVNYMQFVLTIEDYYHPKPHPEPYLTAVSRFQAEPEDCIIVEDSPRGLKSAVAAGIDCIIVKNHFTSQQDFTGAHLVLDSIGELPNILRKM